eukprot:872344-Pyramimonas_sp.AAC.1
MPTVVARMVIPRILLAAAVRADETRGVRMRHGLMLRGAHTRPGTEAGPIVKSCLGSRTPG